MKKTVSFLCVLAMLVALCPMTAFAQTVSVRSISVEPITLIEKCDGYYDYEYDWYTGEYFEYFRYYPEYSMQYTVTWSNGDTSYGENSYLEYQGEEYWLETETNQSHTTPWVAGKTYTMTVSLMGVSASVPVTIAKSPIKTIKANPITLIENCDGYYDYDWETGEDLEYYRYSLDNSLTYTITWKDGTTTSGEGGYVEYQGHDYWIEIETNQSYTTPWVAGNTYIAKISVLGASANVSVTIEESPIQSIELAPITLIENIDGYYAVDYDDETGEDMEYYRYSPEYSLAYTITWTDGTTTSGEGDYVEYQGKHYWIEWEDSQSYMNPWKVGGLYIGTATLMGVAAEATVTIEPSPIARIEMLRRPTKTQYENGEYINLDGLKLRVHYTDGSYEDAELIDPVMDQWLQLKKYDFELEVELDKYIATAGMTGYVLSVFEDEFTVAITVANRTARAITIRDDKTTLQLTVNYDNGSQTVYHVVGMVNSGYYTRERERMYYGLFATTTNQYFQVMVYRNIDTGDMRVVWGFDEDGLTSNTLSGCVWFDLQAMAAGAVSGLAQEEAWSMMYDGRVTADNIDALLEVLYRATFVLMDDDVVISSNWEKVVMRADGVSEAFEAFYGVTPDVTLSRTYNPANHTLEIPGEGGHGVKHSHLFAIQESNDGYTTEVEWYDAGTKQVLVFNRDLQLVAINNGDDNTGAKTGDLNGDDALDMRDAFALYAAVSGASNLTNAQKAAADMNGDGEIDMRDAFALYKIASGG